MASTPIMRIQTDAQGNEIYVKRDDLLPFSFGGNKVRIAREFLDDMKSKGKNCVVGYGNTRSNLSRALANLCCAEGVACHIVSPADEDGTRIETANSRLVKSCGAAFHTCSKQRVAETVAEVLQICTAQGLKPYYIYGDKYGKGNEAVPVRAYDKVYREIRQQAQGLQVQFDYIFLATGTGMTQAGLLAGKSRCGGSEEIIGISVARNAQKEISVIQDFLNAYAAECADAAWNNTSIHVVDDYLCGGYGEFNDEIRKTIMDVFRQTGVPMDPTYTGKAFYGMRDYLEKNQIQKKKILFLHTGGTPLFFDFLRTRKDTPDLCQSCSREQVAAFLREIDTQLPTSLSSRVDLGQYTDKVMKYGRVLAVVDNGRILSAVLFYCNDSDGKNAYVTMLGTLRGFEGNGYGSFLMQKMEAAAKAAGMERVVLDTEPANGPAIALYCKCGYRIAEYRDKVRMVKELC